MTKDYYIRYNRWEKIVVRKFVSLNSLKLISCSKTFNLLYTDIQPASISHNEPLVRCIDKAVSGNAEASEGISKWVDTHGLVLSSGRRWRDAPRPCLSFGADCCSDRQQRSTRQSVPQRCPRRWWAARRVASTRWSARRSPPPPIRRPPANPGQSIPPARVRGTRNAAPLFVARTAWFLKPEIKSAHSHITLEPERIGFGTLVVSNAETDTTGQPSQVRDAYETIVPASDPTERGTSGGY